MRRLQLLCMLVLALASGACGTDLPEAPSPTSEGTTTPASPATTGHATHATTPAERLESCSAEGLAFEPQGGLPEPVAQMREQIAQAAVTCDYDRLAELAGDRFTYSFGSEDDPAGHWRREEASGAQPLRTLVELLDRPHATIEAEQAQYVWPSAFAYDSWAEVPQADREALRPLYGERDFAQFEQFGGYLGHRVGISTDGEWLFFVAGD